MTCATCLFRWFGESCGERAQWHCRRDLKAKLNSLPQIGSDAVLQKARACAHWKGPI